MTLVAAAPDPGLIALQAADARVARIGWRLQTANATLCSDVRALPGFSVHALVQYAPADRAAVAATFGLGGYPAVLTVVPGSAADRAGLRANDEILAVGDTGFHSETAGPARFAPVAAVETAIDDALTTPPMTLTVIRAGRQHLIGITGDKGCASQIALLPGAGTNADADGDQVRVRGGLLDFVQSDDELAMIIAHELAHNILRHRALHTPSRQAEYEADRLAVWLVARAGYDVDAIVPLWTRLGKKTGQGIFADGSHPRWKDRIARMSAAIAELRAQTASGAALIPPSQPAIQR